MAAIDLTYCDISVQVHCSKLNRRLMSKSFFHRRRIQLRLRVMDSLFTEFHRRALRSQESHPLPGVYCRSLLVPWPWVAPWQTVEAVRPRVQCVIVLMWLLQCSVFLQKPDRISTDSHVQTWKLQVRRSPTLSITWTVHSTVILNSWQDYISLFFCAKRGVPIADDTRLFLPYQCPLCCPFMTRWTVNAGKACIIVGNVQWVPLYMTSDLWNVSVSKFVLSSHQQVCNVVSEKCARKRT